MAKENLMNKIAQGKKHFGKINQLLPYAIAGKKKAVKKQVNADL